MLYIHVPVVMHQKICYSMEMLIYL